MTLPIATPSAATSSLPSYRDDELARLDANALIDLIVADEDRVPRNVIDAAARLGEPMVAALQARLASIDGETASNGEWWLQFHAAMILGLIASESAGLLLVELLRVAVVADDNLDDWLSGCTPALFANKPASVLAPLRELSADRSRVWYHRTDALDAVLAAGLRAGPTALDAELDGVARMAADEDEDWDMRLACGDYLLDFPRERHRPLVDELARLQKGSRHAHFRRKDVQRRYRAGDDEPPWAHLGNPWKFYSPGSIRQRQERWAREEAEAAAEDADDRDELADEDAYEATEPFVREAPKIGRNDPCPCGSGKKYKKCCMAA